MNTKFILRGFLFALFVLAFIAGAIFVVFSGFFGGAPDGPAPPIATIVAPEGDIPPNAVGMEEWAKYLGEDIQLVGSGFFFDLRDGETIAATTAHSLTLGNTDRPLESIAFGVAGKTDFIITMDRLYGTPGRARLGRDMTVDYVLLKVEGAIESSYVLQPDPRGTPQPGERVILYSGIGDASDQPRKLYGTVHTVDGRGIWVLMDEDFHPGRMSGSPMVSEHTGMVVGMAISAAYNDEGLLIGAHPIGSLVDKAEMALSFPLLIEYGR